MTRTFIALEMNEDVQRHLVEVIRQVALLLPSVRWVDPQGIHLTLAFLGELDDAQVAECIHSAQVAARRVRPFSYTLTRLGAFGSPRQLRVVWMGISETTGSLLRLHRILHQELEQHGFTVDDRPFSPHLTLARIKSPLAPSEQRRLQELLAGDQHNLTSSTSYPIGAIQVIKSELSRAGAHYTVLQNCPLGTA